MWKMIALVGALAAVRWANPLPAADSGQQPGREALVTVQGAGGPTATPGFEGMRVFMGGPIQYFPEGKFWIGVLTVPAPPPLRAQLGLGENEGILVHAVLPKSPAEKAGVKEYDVLLAAGGATLAKHADLLAAAEKAKENPLTIELIRGGKRQTLSITPIQRSAPVVPSGPGALLFGGASAEGNRYFLGVVACGVAPELRKKLNLPEKQGLDVEEVVPKSPAEKAGLKQGDILVRAGRKPIESVADLAAAVQKSEGKAISLELLRDGKPQTVKVAPEKRQTEFSFAGESLRNDAAAMSQWLERQRAEHPGGTFGYHIVHPGVILPPSPAGAIKLPADTSVSISREGDKPAKIVVKQGDKKWELDESELHKLPPDLRPLVEQMTGHGPSALQGVFPSEALLSPGAAGGNVLRLATPAEILMQRRLDEMGRQVKELRKSLEELRGSQKHPPQPAEK